MEYSVETICQLITNADEAKVREIFSTVDKLRDFSQAKVREFEQERQNATATRRAQTALESASKALSNFVNGG